MANRTRKHPGRNRGNLRPDRKVLRQEQAVSRQAEWDSLTDQEKIARKALQGYDYNPKLGG